MMRFGIKGKIDDLTLTSTLAYHRIGKSFGNLNQTIRDRFSDHTGPKSACCCNLSAPDSSLRGSNPPARPHQNPHRPLLLGPRIISRGFVSLEIFERRPTERVQTLTAGEPNEIALPRTAPNRQSEP
jgi:hypothetical protein